MKAQMKAANRCGAPAVVILGPDELSKGVCTLKMMESGDQHEVSLEILATVVADELRQDGGEG